MAKDLFDYLDNKIGEMPDDTPEHIYQNALRVHAKEPVIVIPDVTPRQIRQALVLTGISMESVDAALDSLPEPTKSMAKIEWEYAIAFERKRPLVDQIGQMLGWNDQQLDELWLKAGTL